MKLQQLSGFTPRAFMAVGLTAAAFSLAAPAAHAAGGDTFLTATNFTNIGVVDISTTAGFANDVNAIPAGLGPGSVQAGGSGASAFPLAAGADVFYKFTVFTPGTLNFFLFPQGNTGYDPKIYLSNGPSASNIFLAADEFYANIAETITTGTLSPTGILTGALSAGTYYLGIDSYYSATTFPLAGQGAYRLEVSGTARISPTAAPEPGTVSLAAAGALTGLALRRKRRGAKAGRQSWLRRRSGLRA